jgi:hypothetical protein
MAVADGWPSARSNAGAQNPAYRPARPPPELDAAQCAGIEVPVGTSAGPLHRPGRG